MEQQKNRVRAEVKLPLILIHTPYGLKFFDRVAKWPGAKLYADFNTYLMPAITALAIFLIVGSLMVMFTNAAAREGEGQGGEAQALLNHPEAGRGRYARRVCSMPSRASLEV